MRVYSGTHEVRIDGGEGLIERGAPAVVERLPYRSEPLRR
jgi:hypothetical protein